MIRHAGLIALRLEGLWRGILIEGASAAGKSDLALRALSRGFRLVADDRVLVFACEGRLFGRAPDPLKGLIEVRGLGVVAAPSLRYAEIVLAARCAADGDLIERLPGRGPLTLLGVAIPRFDLAPLEASAPAKLKRALEHLGAHTQQAYQARFAAPGGRSGA